MHNIREITQAEFEQIPSYNAGIAPRLVEKRWFLDDAAGILGVVLFDPADQDWSFVTLRRDDVGVYRAVDLGHSFKDNAAAAAAMRKSMAGGEVDPGPHPDDLKAAHDEV